MAERVFQKIDNFNKGRREDCGILCNQCFYPLPIILWHYGVYFRTIFIPLCLFNRWLSLFNDAAERAFQYLQNCNVLLKVKDNTFFLNLIMEYPRI